MSKFKIEKGVSRINRVKLQASIGEPVASDLVLMCELSNNDRNYVVNELLQCPRMVNFRLTKNRQPRRAQGKLKRQRVPPGDELQR